MLLALATAQRCQTLHLLDISLTDLMDNLVFFTFDQPLKHEKAGKTRLPVTVEATKDKDLCVIRTLKHYLSCTQPLRQQNTCLFISYTKPHHPVTRDTIRRWLIMTMANAGVDLQTTFNQGCDDLRFSPEGGTNQQHSQGSPMAFTEHF